MEASALLPGQSIRLLSRPLRGSREPQCLQFYYHMYGSGTGQLNLHLNDNSGDRLLWQQSGEQSITWLRATVEFQCDSQHQARAEKDVLKKILKKTGWRSLGKWRNWLVSKWPKESQPQTDADRKWAISPSSVSDCV